MKSLIIYFTLFLVISFSLNAQTKTWGLNQCIEYALENNIQIKQNKLSNELNKIDIKQLKANRIPTLNASDNQSFNWGSNNNDNFYSTNTFSINSSVILYNGSQNNNSIK